MNNSKTEILIINYIQDKIKEVDKRINELGSLVNRKRPINVDLYNKLVFLRIYLQDELNFYVKK